VRSLRSSARTPTTTSATPRALWETIDLFHGLEDETGRRLALEVDLDHAELRARVAALVRDPRHASTL
jgi:hypothetical protein